MPLKKGPVPTVRVKASTPLGYMIINESVYNDAPEGTYQLVRESIKRKAKAKDDKGDVADAANPVATTEDK